MELHLLDKLATYSQEAHTKNVFFESDRLKAQVMGLEAGQEIPPCRMDHDVIFLVIEGKGIIVVDGSEEKAIQRSSWVFVPKERETRSLKAETRMTILAIQVKP
jgi:quercetin dioxygenase-like cupin family protein